MLEKIIRIDVLLVTTFAILMVIDSLQGVATKTLERFGFTTNVNSVTVNLKNKTSGKADRDSRRATVTEDYHSTKYFCDGHLLKNTLKNQTRNFKKFWSYSEIELFLKHIADTYPQRAKLISAGRTAENRTIYVMKIGIEIDGNNIVFVSAGMHAKEWNGIMMALYIIHVLVECDFYEHNIGLIDWMIMPVINPDGYVYSFTHPKHRMWIKNRKPCDSDSEKCLKGQDCGVNIDKNFQFMFPASVGSSRNPCSDFYPGTEDGSEYESNTTMEILSSVKRRIKLYLGLRTYGSLIVYPYAAGLEVFVDNPPEMMGLAKQAAETINKKSASPERYSFGSYASTIVPETGTSLDYTKGTLQVPYAYYIHLRGMHQPPNHEILPIISECFYGICEMVKYICNVYPPPKKFLREWKGMRRRRGRRNASGNRDFSYITLATVIGIHYHVGT